MLRQALAKVTIGGERPNRFLGGWNLRQAGVAKRVQALIAVIVKPELVFCIAHGQWIGLARRRTKAALVLALVSHGVAPCAASSGRIRRSVRI
jgi:hypothetical protein